MRDASGGLSDPALRAASALLLGLSVVGAGHASEGGPDSFGYRWRDLGHHCPQPTPDFTPAAQAFPGATDVLGPFTLGFSMPFYGEEVSEVWVSPHGYVTFSDQGPTQPVPQRPADPAPPNHLFAPFWWDAVTSDVTVEAEPGFFHVRWYQTGLCSPTEVHLLVFPDGSFWMKWPLDLVPFNCWTDHVVGYENAAGDQGLLLWSPDAQEPDFPDPDGWYWSACVDPPVLLDCPSATPLACDDLATYDLPAAPATTAGSYSCDEATWHAGNERLFSLTIDDLSRTTITVDDPTLSLFLLEEGACAEARCLAAQSPELDFAGLEAGTYTLVVDREAPGGGATFQLDVACADPFQTVACGGTVTGDTTGQLGTWDAPSCAPTSLDGPEAYHRVQLPADGPLIARLVTGHPDQWVVVHDAALFDAGDRNRSCVAAGRGGVAVARAAAGDHVLVVDGEAGAAGPYTLAVSCTDGVLDCTTAAPIACGSVLTDSNLGPPSDVAAWSCTDELLDGGERVYRLYNPREQDLELSLTALDPRQRVLLLDACDPQQCHAAGSGRVECKDVPAGELLVVVDGPAGSEGPFDLMVDCENPPPGLPDLVVRAVDARALSTGCSDLTIAGRALVTLANVGSLAAPAPFELLLFEDDPGAGTVDSYDPGVDRLLGRVNVGATLGPDEEVVVGIDGAGTLFFRDNRVHVVADATDVVVEADETNNVGHSGDGCTVLPAALTPAVRDLHWTGGGIRPDLADTSDTPVVGDVNADGRPDLVFPVRFDGSSAYIRVIDGATGEEIWTFDDETQLLNQSRSPALADIDGDPGLEVLCATSTSQLAAIDDDGTLIWRSSGLRGGSPGPPSVADIDGDGTPEVIMGRVVARSADGASFWSVDFRGTRGENRGTGSSLFVGTEVRSVVADLNGDGVKEVVAGPTAYEYDAGTGEGRILWRNWRLPDGWVAIGNFDDDPLPELPLMAAGVLYLLEGESGQVKWQRDLQLFDDPFCDGPTESSGGPPTVADIDGDCRPEIVVKVARDLVAVETDGSVRWRIRTSGCLAEQGATAFDFDGDGALELVAASQGDIVILDGRDGSRITGFAACRELNANSPLVVADADGDHSAEIIVAGEGETFCPDDFGVFVFGDEQGRWARTRRIWNQAGYHRDNVCDDGTLPEIGTCASEGPSWLTHGSYAQQRTPREQLRPDVTLAILQAPVVTPTGPCTWDVDLDVLVGNGGGVATLTPFMIRVYQGDPAAGLEVGTAEVASLAPGAFVTVPIRSVLTDAGATFLTAVADDLGGGAGSLWECREDNNSCTAVLPPVAARPADVGEVLRATGHGDPLAPDVTVDLDWSGDNGGMPRPAGEHYHLYRGTTPDALTPLDALEPLTARQVTDSAPRAATRPLVHHYRLLAADDCELESND